MKIPQKSINWWKKHQNKAPSAAAIIVLTIISLATLTRPDGTYEGIFHGSAPEMEVNVKIADKTLNLEWESVQGAEVYEIYHSENDESVPLTLENLYESIQSNALSVTPYKRGYYKIHTEIGSKSHTSPVVFVP
jgi:hypothetical protein